MRLSPSLALVIASCLTAVPARPARADSPATPVTPTAPKPAGAADAPPPDPVKVAAEKQAALVKKGTELCAAGEVAEGLTALRAAWAQHEDAELAATLAACEVKASDWPGAATYFAYALRTVSDPEQRKPLEAAFTDVRARVGAVKVTVSIDGADVFVGDDFAGQSPLPGEVYVAPGTTRITAKRTGYGEVDGTVDVQARGTTTIKLDLAAGSASTPARHFAERRSATPAYVLGALGLVAAGAGASLLAVGATKGAAADSLLVELQHGYSPNPCVPSKPEPGCATLASLRSGQGPFTDVGAGVLAGGGLLLVVGIIYGLRASAAPATDRAGLTFVPLASPSGGGLMAHGTF